MGNCASEPKTQEGPAPELSKLLPNEEMRVEQKEKVEESVETKKEEAPKADENEVKVYMLGFEYSWFIGKVLFHFPIVKELEGILIFPIFEPQNP